MGYTTDFEGSFKLNKKLDDDTLLYLQKFNETRRMKRKLPLEYGIDGEFFVDGSGLYGQGEEDNVVDHNRPPRTQPGLWCQWRPSDDGMTIQWDGGEKFYDYIEWLQYIVKNFLAPKQYVLNGQVTFQGEDNEDFGIINVENNVIKVANGRRSYGPLEAI
jgi:hypothetical protein